MLECLVFLYWQTWGLTENLIFINPCLKDPCTVSVFTAIILSNCYLPFLAKAHVIAVAYRLFRVVVHIVTGTVVSTAQFLKNLRIILNLKNKEGVLRKSFIFLFKLQAVLSVCTVCSQPSLLKSKSSGSLVKRILWKGRWVLCSLYCCYSCMQEVWSTILRKLMVKFTWVLAYRCQCNCTNRITHFE